MIDLCLDCLSHIIMIRWPFLLIVIYFSQEPVLVIGTYFQADDHLNKADDHLKSNVPLNARILFS